MRDGILFNDPHAIEAFKATITPSFRPGLDVAIARYRDDELMGGVVFSKYFKHHSISAEVHSWKRHWLNRDLLFVIFDYAFNQLKVKHIFGESRSTRTSFDFHIGFKPVAEIEGFYPDAAKTIMRMDREDCRFLGIRSKYSAHQLH